MISSRAGAPIRRARSLTLLLRSVCPCYNWLEAFGNKIAHITHPLWALYVFFFRLTPSRRQSAHVDRFKQLYQCVNAQSTGLVRAHYLVREGVADWRCTRILFVEVSEFGMASPSTRGAMRLERVHGNGRGEPRLLCFPGAYGGGIKLGRLRGGESG